MRARLARGYIPRFCEREGGGGAQWGKEVTQCVRTLAAKPNDLSLNPRILMVEGKSSQSCRHVHTCRETKRQTENKKERDRKTRDRRGGGRDPHKKVVRNLESCQGT